MTLTNNIKRQISVVLKSILEEESFEDFLERFDLTAEEVFLHLYESGLIEEDKFMEVLMNEVQMTEYNS